MTTSPARGQDALLGQVAERLDALSGHLQRAQIAFGLRSTAAWVTAMLEARDAAGAAMDSVRAMLDTLGTEPNRSASDVHDTLGHSVTLICVQASAAVALAPRDRDAAGQSIDRVVEYTGLARDQLARLREALSSPGVSRSSPTRTKPLS